MGFRNEKTFSDPEFATALAFVMPDDEARREAVEINRMPDYKGFESATSAELRAAPVKGPRSYDGDILDLLSLVSEDCAERAWSLLHVSRQEGQERRKKFLIRIGPALRKRPNVG